MVQYVLSGTTGTKHREQGYRQENFVKDSVLLSFSLDTSKVVIKTLLPKVCVCYLYATCQEDSPVCTEQYFKFQHHNMKTYLFKIHNIKRTNCDIVHNNNSQKLPSLCSIIISYA